MVQAALSARGCFVEFTQERQLLPDFTFQPPICRLVEGGVESVGEISLARRIAMRLVMGVAILPPIAQIFHQTGGRIAQVQRYRRAAVLLGISARSLVR